MRYPVSTGEGLSESWLTIQAHDSRAQTPAFEGVLAMKQPTLWNRRRFLQTSAGASFLSVAGRLGWAEITPAELLPQFAYIGSEHAIDVYSITSRGWIRRQTVASPRPVAMVAHKAHLYVANGVGEYSNQPRGSVQSFAIDRVTGRLTWQNTTPLSLSGISPRDLAVSPDGRHLVVAVYGGGAYNLLSLEEDGRLGKVTGILKEIGSGPHSLQTTAHPSVVIFDRAGHVLTADQGSDRLSSLSLNRGSLTVAARYAVAAGSGPAAMALSANGEQLYVAHALNGSLSNFRYDATHVLDHKQTVRVPASGTSAALSLHPSGNLLFSTHGQGIHTWNTAADAGLACLSEVRGLKVSRLHAMPDGRRLVALASDAVLSFSIDAKNGELSDPIQIAAVSLPLSLAVL